MITALTQHYNRFNYGQFCACCAIQMALQRCDLPIPWAVSIYSNTVSGLLRHHMLSVWGKLVLCLSNTYYQQMQTFPYSFTFDTTNWAIAPSQTTVVHTMPDQTVVHTCISSCCILSVHSCNSCSLFVQGPGQQTCIKTNTLPIELLCPIRQLYIPAFQVAVFYLCTPVTLALSSRCLPTIDHRYSSMCQSPPASVLLSPLGRH